MWRFFSAYSSFIMRYVTYVYDIFQLTVIILKLNAVFHSTILPHHVLHLHVLTFPMYSVVALF